MRQIMRDVAAFHDHIGQPGPGQPSLEQHAARLELRKRLILAEVYELLGAIDAGDLVGIVHECADVVYAVAGTALTYGLPLPEAWDEVHASNMTKDPGPDGKAVKGPGFRPPDVFSIVRKHLADAEDQ